MTLPSIFFQNFLLVSTPALLEPLFNSAKLVDPCAWRRIIFIILLFLFFGAKGFKPIGYRCRVFRDGPYATGCP